MDPRDEIERDLEGLGALAIPRDIARENCYGNAVLARLRVHDRQGVAQVSSGEDRVGGSHLLGERRQG
ncbi:hypothetical protein [Microbacterium nanhaiense]|uniref:hypothetical protein n=1 Tax=Microbacterium nanhaiense TaxID=1301026 RepID=UPI001E298051|nr:hypothetical protein [Microbacterium nanhaiense]